MYCWNFAVGRGQSGHAVKEVSPRTRTNGRLRLLHLRKLDDTAALRPRALVQDLRELDLARRLEQLDQVLVRGRPRQLSYITHNPISNLVPLRAHWVNWRHSRCEP